MKLLHAIKFRLCNIILIYLTLSEIIELVRECRMPAENVCSTRIFEQIAGGSGGRSVNLCFSEVGVLLP